MGAHEGIERGFGCFLQDGLRTEDVIRVDRQKRRGQLDFGSENRG
jgi:hypothetical protein